MEQWGIALILKIQAAAMPALDLPMRALSGLGEETFYILIIPFLFWSVHRKVGLRLFYFLLLSVIVNSYFKWAWHLPRPYWIDTGIKAMYVETGFGAPSGHSQNALGVWMYLAWLFHYHMQDKRFYYVAGILAVLISFSRLYLGVHFPHDVLSGWLIASVLISVLVFLPDHISKWTEAGSNPARTIVSSLILVLCLGVLAWLVQAFFIFRIPGEWHMNAFAAHAAMGKEVEISPYGIKTVVSSLALLTGVGFALPLAANLGNFNPKGKWFYRIMRYTLGIVIFFVIYLGLSAIFPKVGHEWYYGFRALRYFILALWVIAIAPWLFIKTGLAERA